MIRHLLLTLTAFAALATTTLQAHSVWIEPDGGKLLVRFAEPDSKYEKSPGYLDSLTPPVAVTVVTNTPAMVEAPKKSDHFALVNAAPENVACAETAFTVRGGKKPNFYARWQPATGGTTKPLLTLDLVPTEKAGEVRLYFRGKPLAGIKATLRTPDLKEKELTADAEGLLKFEPTQSGQYLLTVAHHRETLAGFHLGVAYEQTSHNASLVWRQP